MNHDPDTGYPNEGVSLICTRCGAEQYFDGVWIGQDGEEAPSCPMLDKEKP